MATLSDCQSESKPNTSTTDGDNALDLGHTMECYSAVGKNKAHSDTGYNLDVTEDIKLNKKKASHQERQIPHK